MNKWNLTYLFKNQEEFEAALAKIQENIPLFASYEGKLGTKEGFKAYMLLNKETDLVLCKVYQYAHLRHDLNKKEVKKGEPGEYKIAIIFLLGNIQYYQINEFTLIIK